jgi:hypothetical protein|tara:strand:- start:73 stop:231 length:159 start_codon:yes stop_codon:yes gene_type:complete
MEKYIMLCADSEFAQKLYKALDELEERRGQTPDTIKLKEIINNTIELCQEIP